METYQEFLSRIGQFEKKELCLGAGAFDVSRSLCKKVDENNRFRSFYGDTVVFDLDAATKNRLAGIFEQICQAAPECFCERLDTDSLHMTLHDLSNGPVLEDLEAELLENERKVARKVGKIPMLRLPMRSKCIFNMVDTSLVLGLYPADEEAHEQLMKLYHLFDDVKELSYPFTPHITLAYYNIHGASSRSARDLEQVVSKLNESAMEIRLDTGKLFYQRFTSMNKYRNVLALGCMGEQSSRSCLK